ncbi:glycosyl hydrolases family 31-domain-containing protein [Crepidotus variabilis]|uniref:alpha-glucosidase n=1 Tax=Crepidotus variabilis TaxID=179855 RepID=A0A9P6EFN6_9AGAR|nr:glycosyl hydrolases family 31-domain-containing protein [Crepidotus variabilis]
MLDFLQALWLTILTCLLLSPSKITQVTAIDFSSSQTNPDSVAQKRAIPNCGGYTLHTIREDDASLSAKLSLANKPCNIYGEDITDLTVEVTFETTTCLHVNIFDTASEQYRIPASIVDRPGPQGGSKKSSDLVFNYEPSPFAFWVTRRSQPHAAPLFDTRSKSSTCSSSSTVNADYVLKNATNLDCQTFVFKKQYLQLTSTLPKDTNIYGLGEVVASSGFRRNMNSTVQTMWNRDAPDPVDENLYGSHPVYMEHRFDPDTRRSQSHGVFLMSAAGGDVLLQTPPSSDNSLIQYRMIGGVLDFYFFAGPSPQAVIEQYGELIGFPLWQPIWAFGFHLCRWGYKDIAETREQVIQMRKANIPLEVMWNDIELYHAVRDFTTDPISFPAEEVRDFIRELNANKQHYVPIVDAGIPKQVNATDVYHPYTNGAAQDVFIKNPDGTEYIGQVWPGYTVFPDWFHINTQNWWTEALQNWSLSGVKFSGIWLDMNEASSFCEGSCGTGVDLSNTTAPFFLPGNPGNMVVDYPECYNSTIHGPSGNLSVGGRLTCHLDLDNDFEGLQGKEQSPFALPMTSQTAHSDLEINEDRAAYLPDSFALEGDPREALLPWASHLAQDDGLNTTSAKRDLGAGTQKGINLNAPPYSIHNPFERLSTLTIATNATHVDGQVELDTHNLWGLMEEKATYKALQSIISGKRPFIISRSTFPSSGRWTGHWLGDNFSLWSYLRHSISGVLQFQIFQIPFVGPDTCGFAGNTNEELCNRWMQLSAFMPFFRNHNIKGAIPQEPYRWDSVAEASRKAIAIRYALLPYWYSQFALSSLSGTPPLRALFFDFPNEPELFDVDSQFLIGRDILVTPVLHPQATTVKGHFPGRGSVTWRDWYTHEPLKVAPGHQAELPAPLGHINVHIRDGSAILLHSQPAYTIEETRQGSYSLLVSLDSQGIANGIAYVDDGISEPPGPSRSLEFTATNKQLTIKTTGSFVIQPKLQNITILGIVLSESGTVKFNGQEFNTTYDVIKQRLTLADINVDLNEDIIVCQFI